MHRQIEDPVIQIIESKSIEIKINTDIELTSFQTFPCARRG